MLKTLLHQVKNYKKASILTPVFAALESIMEVLIPFVMASILMTGSNSKIFSMCGTAAD